MYVMLPCTRVLIGGVRQSWASDQHMVFKSAERREASSGGNNGSNSTREQAIIQLQCLPCGCRAIMSALSRGKRVDFYRVRRRHSTKDLEVNRKNPRTAETHYGMKMTQ